MQKAIAVGAVTLGVLFGGAGVANATELAAPASTTTTVAQEVENEQESDNTGLWGLAGLLGLLGLLGLKKRRDADYPVVRNAGTTNPPPPRA
ncbi:WGxxGxxG family protein [Mycolicibacterium celeriflavum]|uniref:WGxxGxxG family protein n=1 Tax=Mycolicibacterium celeriflavum TaxID=1249101 RepID=UPI003CF309AF